MNIAKRTHCAALLLALPLMTPVCAAKVDEAGIDKQSFSAYPAWDGERIQGPVRIAYVFVDTMPGKSRADVRVQIENTTGNQTSVTVHCTVISDRGRIEGALDKTISVAAGSTGTANLSFTLKNVRLWSPETPVLYGIKTQLTTKDSAILDTDSQHFGMREIKIGTDLRLYLNGRPILIRGNLRSLDWICVNPWEPTFCERMLNEQRKQGFNYLRHHSAVPPYQWYYDMTDRLGMMVGVEMGFDLAHSADVVKRFYNHPSIIFWGGVNEQHKTGVKPEVQAWYKLIKSLDGARCVYDTSGPGEYDRDTSDILMQHYGYTYPYLKDENMYSANTCYEVDGSAKGVSAEELKRNIESGKFKLTKPQIIHEVNGNAQVYSDKTLLLDARMRQIWESGGNDYARWPEFVKINQKFVNACYKVMIESARRADNAGYVFIMAADSHPEFIRERRWPDFGDMDITGTCDALGFSKPYLVSDFPTMNAAHAVLLDTHAKPRTLWTDQRVDAAVITSCFDYPPPSRVKLTWTLSKEGVVKGQGSIDGLSPKYPGVGKIADISVPMPALTKPAKLVLTVRLSGTKYNITNSWNLWAFPQKVVPAVHSANSITTNIKWVKDLGYAGETSTDTAYPAGSRLVISDKLGKNELDYLENGGRMLLLQDMAKEGIQGLPAIYRHRMYHHTWVGYSMGVDVHDHPALGAFPHEGFNDLQFYQVLTPSIRLILDDLPRKIMPILESVPILEKDWAVNTGYLFEIRVGQGRLLVSGLNLSIAADHECAATWLMGEFVNYCLSDRFQPKYSFTRAEMESALAKMREHKWQPEYHNVY